MTSRPLRPALDLGFEKPATEWAGNGGDRRVRLSFACPGRRHKQHSIDEEIIVPRNNVVSSHEPVRSHVLQHLMMQLPQ